MQLVDNHLIDNFWLSGGGLDTPFLYLRRARFVLSQLSAAYAIGNSEQMDAWRHVIECSGRLLPADDRQELFRSAADSVHSLARLDLVIASIDEQQANAAYGGLERVRDMMERRTRRRSELGLDPLDDMELELAFLRCVLIVKWRGAAADENRMISRKELRESLSGDLLPRMRRHFSVRPPQEPYVDLAIGDQIDWTWVLLIRLLLRFDQEGAASEIDEFNSLHADFLTIKPGFFRSGISEEGTSPFFWDLEIAKLWLLDEFRTQELELLVERRELAFEQNCSRHADNQWMRAFLQREANLMEASVYRG